MPKLSKAVIDATTQSDRDVFVWDDGLPGFGLRVKPSGVKSFLIQYRNREGRSRRCVVGRYGVLTPDEARKEAKALLAGVAKGEDPAEDKKLARSSPTLSSVCDGYLAAVEGEKKPRSIAEDKRNIEKHAKPALGARKIAGITKDDIEGLHRSMKATPIAANRVLALLSTIFGYAEAKGYRSPFSNPCRSGKKNGGIRKYAEKPRERYLSAEELERLGKLLAELERTQMERPETIAAIRLLLFLGARRDEVVDLRWKSVDLDRGMLLLEDSKTGPKTVYLNAPAREVLVSLPRGEPDDYVVGGLKGGRLGGLNHAWQRIRKQADLDDVRLHDLRHSFASVGVGMGAGLPIIGKLLGHSHAATTQRYGHIAPDPAQEIAERIGKSLDAMMKGEKAEVVKMGEAG
jgi:integrase